MDSKLRKLFDYQKFANNTHLDEVIKSVQTEASTELCDDQLFAVAGGKTEEEKSKEKQ